MSRKIENLPSKLKKVLEDQEKENFYETLKSQSKDELLSGIAVDLEILNKALSAKK